ncbi:tol-pal system protein YbgF [Candidatus Methylospira mobilis]|nr:tol-pal system protein YbgF [Candidatus Methylospira mobilis]WNV05149.1 tol-pal system protein YbgF [Candidatus Methylospira mobilis]
MNKLLAGVACFVALWSTAVCNAAPPGAGTGYGEAGAADLVGENTLDERVARLEKRLSNEALMDAIKRSEQLQREVQRLHGDIEVLTHDLNTLKKQQTDRFLSLEQRLQSSEAQAPPPASAENNASDAAPPVERDANLPPAPIPPAQQPVAKPATPPPAAKTSAVDEGREAAYQKGLGLLQQGKYPDSIREFKKFQATYPSGEYVDNAVYWTGEAYYVLRDLPSSKEAFRKLIKDYPQSSRLPDAMLKMAYIEYDSGLWSNAKNALNDVIKRFPGSKVAEAAQKRLTKIKQEGH